MTQILKDKSKTPSLKQGTKVLLNVIDDPLGDIAWDNLCKHFVALKLPVDYEYERFSAFLKEFGATNVDTTPYIEFETEAQKAWFLLRWS